MFRNYLKIAIRNIRRNYTYSFINIVGLAVGLGCFILILLYIQYEFSYDRFYENANQIYRVVQKETGNFYLDSDYYAVTPAPLASTLTSDYPEVTHATTIRDQSSLLSHGKKHFLENGLSADQHFFDVFPSPLLQGSPEKALANPNSIVLTKSLAHKIFGDQDPIGQTLVVQDHDQYTVTGLIPDVPSNSSLQYTFITSIQSQHDYAQNLAANNWTNNWWYTFFTMSDGANATRFQAKLQHLADTHLYSGNNISKDKRTEYLIQPLTDVHLGRQFNKDIGSRGNMTYVYLYIVVAFLILLLACVNYMNLAITRSINRAHEVGMRKVIGAQRLQIVSQFLGESVLMAFLALLLALILVNLLLPVFSHLVERPLRMDIGGNWTFLSGLLVLVLFVGLLSGSYPAIFMTSLQPINALTGNVNGRTSHFRVRKLLIVGQYAISITLLAGSFVVYRQMQFVQNNSLGYNTQNIITVRVRDRSLIHNYQTIRNELLQNPKIAAVTYSYHLPTDINSRGEISGWEGSSKDDHLTTYVDNFGYDFLKVFGIHLAAGRMFSRKMATDSASAVLINETAAHALGWTPEEAVGKHFMALGDRKTIIGVLKDFHMQSMHMRIKPLIVLFNPNYMGYISARVNPDNLQATIALIQRTVQQFSSYPFEYQFLDNRVRQLYITDRRLGETLNFFTFLALIIASFGLFGLASFAAKQRTKEIGIRKVLGATVSNITGLLNKDFLSLVLTGFLIATPIAWYTMNHWLQNFAYHIKIGPGILLLSGAVAMLIALATVSWQSVRAAIADPVKCLRNE